MTSTTKLTFLTGRARNQRAWIARIAGRDPQYGLKREFLKGTEFYDNGPQVTFDVPLIEGEIYEDRPGDFYVVRNGALVEISRHDKAEVLALLDARAEAAEQAAATVEQQQDRVPTEAELAVVRERYRLASNLMCATSKTLAEASAANDRVIRNSGVPAKRAMASLAMFRAWEASDAAMAAFRTVEDELQQAEGKYIQAQWAEDLRCADKVEHALNELLTWADVEEFVSQAARHPQSLGDEDFVASLGSDAIVVLGDGSVLSWGQEHFYGGTTYRDLTVYRDAHSRGQNVLIAEVFKDELEGTDAA